MGLTESTVEDWLAVISEFSTGTRVLAFLRSKDTDTRQCHDIMALEDQSALPSYFTWSSHVTLSPYIGGDDQDRVSPCCLVPGDKKGSTRLCSDVAF